MRQANKVANVTRLFEWKPTPGKTYSKGLLLFHLHGCWRPRCRCFVRLIFVCFGIRCVHRNFMGLFTIILQWLTSGERQQKTFTERLTCERDKWYNNSAWWVVSAYILLHIQSVKVYMCHEWTIIVRSSYMCSTQKRRGVFWVCVWSWISCTL